MDKLIDKLVAERKHAESLGLAQSKEDAMLLLSLLLEDAKLNPQRYARQ